MAGLLKQSTVATLVLGPFVDDTDGKTAETALTVSQTDVRLSKNGGAFAQKADTTSATHMENGYYSCPLNTTDTNTLGRLVVAVTESGALPVWLEYMVVPAMVYDSLVAGSDTLQADVTQISGASVATGSAQLGVNLVNIAGAAVSTTTAQLGVNVVQVSGDATAADNAEAFFDGTGYAGTNNVIPTVTNLTNKGDGSGFTAIPWNAAWDAEVQSECADALTAYDPPTNAELVSEINAVQADIAALSIPTAGAIADAVWDEALSGHATAGSAGEALSAAGTAGDPWTTALPGAYGAGTAGSILGNLNDLDATEVQTAAAAALTAYDPPTHAELTAEIDAVQTDVATRASQASVNTIDDLLDTEVAAIKAVVDAIEVDTQDIQGRLPAALVSGRMSSDVQAISGDSTAADRLEALMDGLLVGQVNGAATTTAFAADGFTEATDDHFVGRLITFLTGALTGQQTAITDYVGATQTFTVEALTEAPADDSFFVIH